MRKIDTIVWKCEARRSSSNNREIMSVNFTSFVGGKEPTKEYPEPIPAVGDTVDMHGTLYKPNIDRIEPY